MKLLVEYILSLISSNQGASYGDILEEEELVFLTSHRTTHYDPIQKNISL